MTEQRLRWGILGTGNIARQFAGGVAAARRSVVAAVASRGAETAEAFARQFGIGAAYGSYDELLRNPDVDAVYVSLPNTLHHPWSIRALQAGKHVLCEKPIAASAAEAVEMFDVARHAGRLLVEAFMYRSHPLTRAVLDVVRGGEIGQVKLIRTSFCFRTSKLSGNIRFDPSLAGGSLMDVGCYCLNFSRLIAGEEPERFEVVGHLNESGVDDLAAGLLHFRSGIVATFQCGILVQGDNTATVSGDGGYVEVPVPWKPPRENAAYVVAHSTPPKMDGGTAAPKPRAAHTVSASTELYGLEADDFAASVFDGAPARVSPADSLGNMRLLDAMRKKLEVRMP